MGSVPVQREEMAGNSYRLGEREKDDAYEHDKVEAVVRALSIVGEAAAVSAAAVVRRSLVLVGERKRPKGRGRKE